MKTFASAVSPTQTLTVKQTPVTLMSQLIRFLSQVIERLQVLQHEDTDQHLLTIQPRGNTACVFM